MDDPVFAALADPTRRHLLDVLFERDGRALGELVEAVPGMTRFGVMKHLRILEAADLVTTRRAGREKHHYLNPVPIRRLHDRWLDKYRARAADTLIGLQHALEQLEDHPMPTATAPAFVSTVYIRATPEKVWQALTETDFTKRYYYGNAIESTFESGAPYRMIVDGKIQIEGKIVDATPPRRLVQTFRGVWVEEMKGDAPTRVTWEIDDAGHGVSKVTLVHEGLVEGSATHGQVTGGWPYILSGLKSVLETGRGFEEA